MLDLGGTLLDANNKVLPFVPAALKAIKGIKTEAGDPLAICLVSDFLMPTPQKSEAVIFQEYVSLLRDLNLLKFFKPVARHITLSTHAGVNKPDRKIFELAITRLGLTAQLGECLFITENNAHIVAARNLGMKTLRFNAADPDHDFADWQAAPALISRTVNPGGMNLLELNMEKKKKDDEREKEERHYIKTLDDNKQIGRGEGPLGPGETHRETVDEKGEKRIKRERFSAF